MEDMIRELEQAEQKPIAFDDDCPEMTVAQLLEFKPFHQKKQPKQKLKVSRKKKRFRKRSLFRLRHLLRQKR